ncbi:hypothetical protein GCM10010442_43610 [Kitasatospora kifunensis]
MARTGENYTTAAAALSRQRTQPTGERLDAIRDRQERYLLAEQEARLAAESQHLALWSEFGETYAPLHLLDMVLRLPTGEYANWTTYSCGGRDLARQIDQQARDSGFGLADFQVLRDRHRAADYDGGPLRVVAWDLAAVLRDIEAGGRATEEQRAWVAERSPFSAIWFGFHQDGGAQIAPPENIDFAKYGIND